jgi:nucleotide-binding universal stress UspA family protein
MANTTRSAGRIGHVGRRLEASSAPTRGLHDTALSERRDLLVIGSSHHGPVGRLLLRSVGERLLSGAPCAVAIAPRGYAAREPRQIRRIAAAFDESPEAGIALRAAHGLATSTGAALRVLMVIEPPTAIPGHFVPQLGLEQVVTIERAEALQRQELAARSALDSALQGLGQGASIEQDVLVGTDPAGAILDAVGAEIELLVLGSRGYGPARRTLTGSVSHAVLRHARCPVLVTPRTTEHDG